MTSSDGAPPHDDGTAVPWQQPGGSCLHVAISYALDLNWAVFPANLRGVEKKSHKSAAYSKNGSRWGSTKDPRLISADFKRWPDAVGVPTGAVNSIFVIEADTPQGHKVDGITGLEALQVKHGPLPDTLMAESPTVRCTATTGIRAMASTSKTRTAGSPPVSMSKATAAW